MEKIISVNDFVRNAASIAREVETEGTVYRITRGGRRRMVLVDAEYFNGWIAALEEIRRPDWREVHGEATKAIAEDRGEDLDVVVKELGLEGSAHRTGRKPASPCPSPPRMNHLTSPGEATAEVTVAAMARAAIVGATCETAFQNSERRVVRCDHGPRCRTLTADRRGVPGVGTRAVGEA